MTPRAIANAWHSSTGEYGVRKNKARRDGRIYEVYRLERDVPLSDKTLKVIAAFSYQERAVARAQCLDDEERGRAVLELFE